MSKVIKRNKGLQLKVTGIAKDVPSNSHLYFDLVEPISHFKDAGFMTTWISNGVFTYVLLAPHVSEQRVENRLPQFVEKYLGGDLRKYGFKWTLSLIHQRFPVLIVESL